MGLFVPHPHQLILVDLEIIWEGEAVVDGD